MLPARANAFHGIYVATICPLRSDGGIDEAALARHLDQAMAADGIVGVLINGHAGENFSLTREEKRRVTEIANRTIGDRAIIVCGLNTESSAEAAQHARDAEAAGADALMVFPPYSWSLSQDRAMAFNHHRIIGAASGLPMMLYQAGVGAGEMAYVPEVLAELVKLPSVVAIKEGSWETARYEANRRLVKRIAPHVAVMASGDEHLLPCFALGSEGSLVSLAVLVPDLIVGLARAIDASDLATARALNDRIFPLAKAIYGTRPGGYATARLKICLRLLGRLECDATRSPLGPLPAAETEHLRQALAEAGL
jgi:4-hydroxy-tetrahydrodipicolinate synthase